MVFEDLSEVEHQKTPKMAPIADRLLALVIDLSIFWPLFSVMLAGLLRKLQYRYYSAPDSTEFWVLFALVSISYAGLMILTQGIFWSVLGATPGQFFFQLRIVRHKSYQHPTLQAAWLRSFLFWIECVFLFGLPFLEVFSHSERRAFHDRAAETDVITLKRVGLEAPHLLEKQFVRSVFTVCLAMSMVWAFALASHFYRQVNRGAFKETELTHEDYLCEEVPKREGAERLDSAVAMYLTGNLSSDCLATEIDFGFWKGENRDQAWASFGMAVLNDHDLTLSEAYLTQACVKDKGQICELAKWWKNRHQQSPGLENSWTQKVLAVQHFEKQQDIAAWSKELEEFPADFELQEFIEKEKIKLFWAQNKREQAMGAYSVVWDSMSAREQRSLSTDLCFSEITEDCSVRNYKFCRDLEKNIVQDSQVEVHPTWVLALAEEKLCRKTGQVALLRWAHEIDPDSENGKFLLAIADESNWSEEKRLDTLRTLAFNASKTSLVTARALFHLLKSTPNLADLEKGYALLSDRSFPFRQEIQKTFTKTAQKMNFNPSDRKPASTLEAK